MSVKDFVSFLSTDPQLADVGRTVKTVDLLNLSKSSKAHMSGGKPRTALVVDGEDCLVSPSFMGNFARQTGGLSALTITNVNNASSKQHTKKA